ncbi:sulfurtransferase TusA family protein [Snodgrassella sp. CFCC 13594]|uniref:sulfurtransferase TusA family protein n=1 Tax=Snodgrassella sp. CFCC 13594 TaxID=1775559 RepID=UPI0008362EAE|nr:sulfurtransferase TusA family protein [Snodgrassella sp. CFCC 13594]
MTAVQHTLDVVGLKCPMPILKAKKALAQLQTGDVLTVLATDGGAPDDFAAFCRQTGHELLSSTISDDAVFEIVVKHK